MLNIDAIDKEILGYLQQDAKMNIKELADKLKMTKTPVYERIKRLEKEGYISGYVALLNKKKLDLPLIVFCEVTLTSQHIEFIEAFSNAIKEIPEIVECYLLGGVFDYLIKIVVPDLDHYYSFASRHLASLPNVSKIQSLFVLNEIKYSTALPLDNNKS
ncbi:Lrp/AsnC family transcriptional regulator [Microscilla marina]|uniref:AsnC family transcriptional regulator n=1 Tax=Microscilla marina ATCC 23134 TaxID=313606 RepID=A1ZU71_MICM2|nr:Lrp/AsnC family transcriptional regulator [Microscilla marina]EAY26042.1 AsnC family transcriptional regulator [Microscilla marina ATCC 23134]